MVADARLDVSIRACLADGTILLVRAAWLISAEADAALGRDAHSGRAIMRGGRSCPRRPSSRPRRRPLFDRGDRSINSLTYRWLTGAHPDPDGHDAGGAAALL